MISECGTVDSTQQRACVGLDTPDTRRVVFNVHRRVAVRVDHVLVMPMLALVGPGKGPVN